MNEIERLTHFCELSRQSEQQIEIIMDETGLSFDKLLKQWIEDGIEKETRKLSNKVRV